MTHFKLFAVLLLLTVYFCSCDCVQIAKAKVVAAETQNPADSVCVIKEGRTEQNTLTDENGKFELRSISGGFAGCPSMTIVLRKKGYQTKTINVGSDTATIIYLNRN